MNAGAWYGRAAHFPVHDQLRLRWIFDVVNAEAAAEVAGSHFTARRLRAENFVVREHDAVADSRLVRVRAERHRYFGEQLWILRICNIDDGTSMWIAHVPDKRGVALDHYL